MFWTISNQTLQMKDLSLFATINLFDISLNRSRDFNVWTQKFESRSVIPI